jgi:signal transduction histidine kinase
VIITFLCSLSAGVALALTAVCALLSLAERQERLSLSLCIAGIAAAACAYYELRMMQSATPAEYGLWLRWYNLCVYVAVVGLLLFVHNYLGTGRLWLMGLIVLARSLLVVVNFCVQPNFNFRRIVSLNHVSIFGEQVATVGASVTRGWQWLAGASMILLLIYLIDAAAQRWSTPGPDSRRKALAVALGIAAPMVCTVGLIYAAILGALPVPVLNTPSLLGALFTLAYEMGRGIILSGRARVEVSELRSQLAQVERVSVVSQLTSTLAHELTQPLTASIANAEAALRKLAIGRPNLEELRTILSDIRSCDRLAADMVARMRDFFRRRIIEMQPINVGDFVDDVVALVRSQVNSKGISLSLLLQPRLPRVSGDRVHLTQVLLNLVMNGIEAVQSRPPGVRRIIVEARSDDKTREIEMSVRDSGLGVPGSIGEKLFQPFFTTKPDGMGMGLALSRTIIEAHGGRLWSEHTSASGGATFRFTLRCA